MSIMNKTYQVVSITFFTAFLIFSCTTTPEPVSKSPDFKAAVNGRSADELRREIDSLAEPAVEEGWTKSMAMAFVHPAGTEMMFYGQIREGEDAPDKNTIFEIGSVSKVMTGMLLAEMVARGELRFDTPVKDLLPESFSIPSLNGREISLLDLATHVSGLPRMPDNFSPENPENPYIDYSPDLMAAFLEDHELRREPGTKAEYSNLGSGFLGYALAQHAGTSYEDLLRERILLPLGMYDTTIELDENQGLRFAPGHNASGDPVSAWDIPTLGGAGAVRSSLSDMLLFLKAGMGITETPLQHVIDSTRIIRGPFNDENTMGLGWLISPAGICWHNGMTGGYHAFIAFDHSTGVGLVVLANTATQMVSELGGSIMRLLRNKPYNFELPEKVTVSEEILARYIGKYKLAPGAVFTISMENGRLFAQLTGQPSLQIHPESDTEFNYRTVPARIVFQLDDDGEVSGLVLHQGGQKMPARRLADEEKEE